MFWGVGVRGVFNELGGAYMGKVIRLASPGKRLSVSKSGMEQMLRHLEEIYRKRGITTREKNRIWQTMAVFCFYQLKIRRGLFYKAARHLLKPSSPR